MMCLGVRGANCLLDHVLLMTDVGGVVRVSKCHFSEAGGATDSC